MPTSVVVTMHHARAASLTGAGVLCATGIRAWCQRYGINLREFMRDGIAVERVDAIDCAFARRAAALARKEAQHG